MKKPYYCPAWFVDCSISLLSSMTKLQMIYSGDEFLQRPYLWAVHVHRRRVFVGVDAVRGRYIMEMGKI